MIFNNNEIAVIEGVKTNIQLFMNARVNSWNGPFGFGADCVIAGGYFASAFRGEDFKDIDVFILNNNVNLYTDLTFGTGNVWSIRDKSVGHYLQNPHIHATALNKETKVQIILTDYTSRKELLDSFDYLHTTVSYVPAENKLYITRGAFDACRKKQLRPNGSNQPKQWRFEKFVKRGWDAWATDREYAAITGDYNQAIKDSYDQIVQKAVAEAVADMFDSMKPRAYTIPADVAKDIDIEAFKALVK